ncbi:MAG TPA: efflux RND transporter periplasmic adaptor subunit [Terriglobales bacterium]|nr:efflux RND transporter periplasmic adaptor subunit [Terriglobales bacterium]
MAQIASKTGFLARNRWLIWTLAIVGVVVLLASFRSRDEAVPVHATTVTRSTIRSVVSTNGKVEPSNNFEAHAPIGTTVKKLLVHEGDHVKKGQLLVQLDDAEARSQAARALSQIRASDAEISAVQSGGNQEEVFTLDAQLIKARTEQDAAQRNLDALKRLQQSGAASPGEVKTAQEQLDRAAADLKLLQQKQKDRYSKPEIAKAEAGKEEALSSYAASQDILNQLNIRAPFDGVVYSLPLRQGNYVNPGDLVLQEADLSKVVVRAFVDEPDIARLSPGDKIEVTWDAMPSHTWTGTVNTVPATVKLHGTRNVGETTCIVDNHDFKLLPNVNVGVTIVTSEHRDVLTIPREALRQDDGTPYVLQIVNNELKRQNIQTSIANLTEVEVTAGLSENEEIALSSTNSKPLYNNTTVKVIH